MTDQEPKWSEPHRVRILQTGMKLTSGNRDKSYGDPKVNLACFGELIGVFHKYVEKSRRDVGHGEYAAIVNVLSKISRVACGPGVHEDNYIDGATYFAIAGECASFEEHLNDLAYDPNMDVDPE